uniref:PWWP domain-containing protein n=1 Tax=Dendroctonus ponderosae TaxID=77166 RepID=A0AAR5QFT4_DENPD
MRSPKVQQYLQIKDNNSFVWAKIRGSSYWPAIVVKDNSNIPLKAPENKQWVYFLHTHNYYWVKNENMKPYKKFKEQFRKKRTDCAMNEMDDIIRNVTIDAGYKIALVPYEPSASSRIKRSNTKSPKVNNTQARRTPRVPTPRHIAADVDCKVVKSKQFFGFLAGSIYSEGIIKNLINAQHKLCVWSINANLSKSLQSYAIKRRSFLTVCTSPREVLQCTSQEALDGEIAILAAGSQPLFESCQSCFDSISRTSRFLGPLGSARKMHLLFQMMKGVFIATLVEGFTMADRSCLEMDAFNDALQATSMSNDYLKNKADAIEINRMALPKHTQDPIEQMQSEISQGLELADKHLHPMPLTSYTNQLFKNARRLERDGKDAVSIFQTSY